MKPLFSDRELAEIGLSIPTVEKAEVRQDGSIVVWQRGVEPFVEGDVTFSRHLAAHLESVGVPVSYAGLTNT